MVSLGDFRVVNTVLINQDSRPRRLVLWDQTTAGPSEQSWKNSNPRWELRYTTGRTLKGKAGITRHSSARNDDKAVLERIHSRVGSSHKTKGIAIESDWE